MRRAAYVTLPAVTGVLKRSLVTLLAVGAALALGSTASGAATGSVTPGLTYLTSARNGSHETAWLAGPGGRHARRLGPATGAMLAPDGQLVAVSYLTFSHRERSTLTLYSSSGAVAAAVFKAAASYQATPVAWSADSRYLAVNVLAIDRSSPYRTGLYTVDATTGTVTPVAYGYIYGASFSPSASSPDELVYGLAHVQTYNSRVNLYTTAADGSGPTTQLTRNGRSLNPVWATSGILFDHERIRGHNAPEYQVTVLRGGRTITITHSRPNLLVQGLVPIAVSANGRRLLAMYQGQDTAFAWTVDLVTHRARALKLHGKLVFPDGISRDGRRVLVDYGDFQEPPSAGTVYAMGFSGGHATALVHHAGGAGWNQ